MSRKKIFAGLAVWVVLFLATISENFEPLAGFVFILAALSAITCAFVGFFTKQPKGIILSGWIVLLSFTAMVCAAPIKASQDRATMQVAESLISAIERCHADSGVYPKSLDALVPKYLPTVPKTRFGFGGSEFFYFSHPEGFSLGFNLPALFMQKIYDSKAHGWSIHD
jgi:hypothetical protein